MPRPRVRLILDPDHIMPRVDHDSFYRSALARHGHTAGGVHWNSAHTQRARFKALRQLLPKDLSDLRIADAGCGLGDFYLYLLELGALPESYTGIDVVKPMVEAARARTGCRILRRDILRDPLPEADYFVCSGAMNTLTREETSVFIERCFMASTAGFVFNLLRGQDTSTTYNECMPEDVCDWTAHLDTDIVLDDSYLSGDFAVALTRRRPCR